MDVGPFFFTPQVFSVQFYTQTAVVNDLCSFKRQFVQFKGALPPDPHWGLCPLDLLLRARHRHG